MLACRFRSSNHSSYEPCNSKSQIGYLLFDVRRLLHMTEVPQIILPLIMSHIIKPVTLSLEHRLSHSLLRVVFLCEMYCWCRKIRIRNYSPQNPTTFKQLEPVQTYVHMYGRMHTHTHTHTYRYIIISQFIINKIFTI